MQKNNGRTKKMASDDARTKEINDLVPEKPLDILSISCDSKGNIYGLGNNGKLYRYSESTRDWVML